MRLALATRASGRGPPGACARAPPPLGALRAPHSCPRARATRRSTSKGGVVVSNEGFRLNCTFLPKIATFFARGFVACARTAGVRHATTERERRDGTARRHEPCSLATVESRRARFCVHASGAAWRDVSRSSPSRRCRRCPRSSRHGYGCHLHLHCRKASRRVLHSRGIPSRPSQRTNEASRACLREAVRAALAKRSGPLSRSGQTRRGGDEILREQL